MAVRQGRESASENLSGSRLTQTPSCSLFQAMRYAMSEMLSRFSAGESCALTYTGSCEWFADQALRVGVLMSNSLRPPPGQQSRYERYSVAFFTRPQNSVVLRPLVEASHVIADAVAKNPKEEFYSGATAGEWTARRIRKLRLRNRKVSIPRSDS